MKVLLLFVLLLAGCSETITDSSIKPNTTHPLQDTSIQDRLPPENATENIEVETEPSLIIIIENNTAENISENISEPRGCELPQTTKKECQSTCTGACEYTSKAKNGDGCYECNTICPSGYYDNIQGCMKNCDGTCKDLFKIEDQVCYVCSPISCPDNSYISQTSCEKICPYGICNPEKITDSLTCYSCRTDCTEYCEAKSYSPNPVNHTKHILSVLKENTCVTSVSIDIPSDLQYRECKCYNTEKPVLTFNHTKPVCPGTPCGSVVCGTTKTCLYEGEEIDIICGWGGWKQTGEYEFAPN